ncbi:MAG TPA: RagB/SusD family nutrient uptake outer membrane protein [Niabella sp.]|nr:RagB/SusD family nutrient uptake outer membrane protein [Niabella sp.]
MFNLIIPLRFLYIAVIITITSSVFSCKKFIDIAPPPNQAESIKIFSNDQTAISAITGIYSILGLANSNFLNGGITLYTAAASDEISTTAPNADLDPFLTNSINPSHSNLFNRLWGPVYGNTCIYSANAVIEGLTKSSGITDTLKDQLINEAKVIRALGYFYLVNMYGDVPLVITTDYRTSSLLPRHSVSVIYNRLKEDLLSAFNTLHTAYPSSGRARINKWVACALLARIYLYTEDWSNAELFSGKIIESGQYTLNNDLGAVFTNTNSNETIWQLVRDNSPTSDGATFIPSSSTTRPTYTLSPSLFSSFENGDKRKIAWVSKNTVTGIEYYFPYKYKSRTAAQPREYSVLFRLAEQFLIRAEARNHLGNLDGAASDLNTIRARAGLPVLSELTKEQILDTIMNERRSELFCEMGHRWFDLKRTKRVDAVLSSVKGTNWQNTDALFPIPQQEIEKNPFLTQNPGYDLSGSIIN